MNCNKKFTRSILIDLFKIKFINGIYKENIKELLFKEEIIKIPQSLPEVEYLMNIKKYTIIVDKLRKEFTESNFNIEIDLNSFIKQGEITSYLKYISYLKNNFLRSKNKKEKKEYKYPCANNDCNGFVNNKWKCELCDKDTCKECLTIKLNDLHICNQDDIDTCLLLKKDSKPCPKCNISIMKTSGCNQMWCVNCHTTFDWVSLNIRENGQVHNPEYFRYMRENGLVIPTTNNLNDDICVNLFQESVRKLTVINNNMLKNKKSDKNIAILFDLCGDIRHIINIEIPDLRRKTNNLDLWKNTQRIRFIMKDITEKQYKTNLAKKHKEIDFLDEMYSIQNTIYEVCKESFISIVNEYENSISYKESIIFIKLKEFIKDFKETINKIQDIYQYDKYIYTPRSLLS
jgi:hypothetical protein